MVHQRDQEIEDRMQQIDDLKTVIQKKDKEIANLNKEILKHKDDKLDIETKLDS